MCPGCELTPDLSCPDFFSHLNNNCEGDPGGVKQLQMPPHTAIGANAEPASGSALWVTSLSLKGTNPRTLTALTGWQMDAKLPHIFKRNNIIAGRALCRTNVLLLGDHMFLRSVM